MIDINDTKRNKNKSAVRHLEACWRKSQMSDKERVEEYLIRNKVLCNCKQVLIARRVEICANRPESFVAWVECYSCGEWVSALCERKELRQEPIQPACGGW